VCVCVCACVHVCVCMCVCLLMCVCAEESIKPSQHASTGPPCSCGVCVFVGMRGCAWEHFLRVCCTVAEAWFSFLHGEAAPASAISFFCDARAFVVKTNLWNAGCWINFQLCGACVALTPVLMWLTYLKRTPLANPQFCRSCVAQLMCSCGLPVCKCAFLQGMRCSTHVLMWLTCPQVRIFCRACVALTHVLMWPLL